MSYQEVCLFGKPPEAVPDGLTAQQYYELGIWYDEYRLPLLARDCFQRAIALQPDGQLAVDCKRFVNSRLSVADVPQEAISQIERAELEVRRKPAESRKVARSLIELYPQFERPYRLLAEIDLNNGDMPSCREHLETALKLNPDYAQAVAMMARAQAIDMEYQAAGDTVRRARQLLPNDAELRLLERSIEVLVSFEDDE